ncbi:MAG: hypothetical protein EOS61_23750, partial [Mesorhizobium sp.]
AQAERNEAAADNGGGRRQRRPRRGRGSAEQGYSAEPGNGDEGNAGRADSPADDGGAAENRNDAVVTGNEPASAAPSESVANEPAGGTGEPAVADANN